MKLKLITGIIGGMLLTSCDGSTSNPATVSRAELTAPNGLHSVTGDSQIELRWAANNAEEEFQGFQVFGAQTTLEKLYPLVKYPVALTSADQLLYTSVPHCKDNSKFYEAFGFDAYDEDCEDGEAEQEAAGTGSTLLTAKKYPEDLPPKSKLACVGDDAKYTNENVSVKLSGIAMDPQKCVVKTYWNGTEPTALENGKEYVFIVVSVKGDEFDEKSWSSNAVMDIPSKTALEGTYTLKRLDNPSPNTDANSDSQFRRFELATDNSFTAKDPETCSGDICTLNGTNSGSSNAIYIGRDAGSADTGYPQRLFISTQASGRIELQPVGRATVGGDTGRLPGDQAIEVYPTTKGSKFEVLGDQIFDIKITNADSSVNYGKVIVTDVSYASKTNNLSEVSFKVTIVVQPKANSTYYLQ
jgi:hypothetical protein